MKFNTINYDLSERIGTITLNRPDKRNALNRELITELQQAFDLTAGDDNVKVIVLRANGPAFSAGADLDYLKAIRSGTYEENLVDSQRLGTLYRTIYAHPKPTIAMVKGAAVAGGCGLITVCDFILATSASRFGYSESRIGFVPALVMIFLLKRVGEVHARRMLLSGELISADEALRVGLITDVLESDDIETRVRSLSAHLRDNCSAESMKRIKEMLVTVPGHSLDAAMSYAAEVNARARQTDDFRQGIEAFLEKKEVRW